MEWYKQELDQPPPTPRPPTLFQLTLRAIHNQLTQITHSSSSSTTATPSESTIFPSQSIVTSSSSSLPSSTSTISSPSPFRQLPSHVLQQVLVFLMRARRQGSRSLNEATVGALLVPALTALDLEGFWVSHVPFVDHYDCPYLTVLNLKNCLIMQDLGIQKICSVSPNIEVMILKNLHHLTRLSARAICGEGITNSKGCKELQVLAMSCQKMDESDIIPVIDHCKKLRVLKLQRGTKVRADLLVKQLQQLDFLEVLVLNRCEVTDNDFQQLLSCQHLRELKIENSTVLTGKDIKRTSVKSMIAKLKLVECIQLEDIANMLYHCPNLNSLCINSCKKVTDETLMGLLEFQNIINQMESFTVQHNTRVTDASIKPLLWRFGNGLKVVDLSSCTKISKIFQSTSEGVDLKLKQLECLVLDGCKSIDFFNIPNDCIFPNLMYLDISGVTINDGTLIKIIEPLTQLHTLHIKCCHGLNGSFCLRITQNNLVPNLLRLQMANCTGIQEVKILGVRHPLKIAMNSLRFLDIAGLKIRSVQIDCPNLEILDVSYTLLQSIENIISGVPKLTNFWAKRQGSITADLLRHLAHSCLNLQVMDITFCEAVPPSSLLDVIPLFKNVYRIYYGSNNSLSDDEAKYKAEIQAKFSLIVV